MKNIISQERQKTTPGHPIPASIANAYKIYSFENTFVWVCKKRDFISFFFKLIVITIHGRTGMHRHFRGLGEEKGT